MSSVVKSQGIPLGSKPQGIAIGGTDSPYPLFTTPTTAQTNGEIPKINGKHQQQQQQHHHQQNIKKNFVNHHQQQQQQRHHGQNIQNSKKNSLSSSISSYQDDSKSVGEDDADQYGLLDEYPDESSLFVGDLSRTVQESMLLEYFSKYGEVESVDIKRDKVTGNNLGYGFVKFRKRSEAELAKEKLHGFEIGGRSIRIGWAQKNTNLFVGDLHDKITTEQLRDIFKLFGPIYESETFVKRNRYGFVKFKHRTHAEKAKASLDGKPLNIKGLNLPLSTHPVRIGWGDANTQRNCVHVQFDPSSAELGKLTEDDFREHFKHYGNVVKVSMPRYADKKLKGYGFVHFEENDDGEESAAHAITSLSGTSIKDVEIICNFGKRQNNRHKRFHKEEGGPNGGTNPNGTNGTGPNGNKKLDEQQLQQMQQMQQQMQHMQQMQQQQFYGFPPAPPTDMTNMTNMGLPPPPVPPVLPPPFDNGYMNHMNMNMMNPMQMQMNMQMQNPMMNPHAYNPFMNGGVNTNLPPPGPGSPLFNPMMMNPMMTYNPGLFGAPPPPPVPNFGATNPFMKQQQQHSQQQSFGGLGVPNVNPTSSPLIPTGIVISPTTSPILTSTTVGTPPGIIINGTTTTTTTTTNSDGTTQKTSITSPNLIATTSITSPPPNLMIPQPSPPPIFYSSGHLNVGLPTDLVLPQPVIANGVSQQKSSV